MVVLRTPARKAIFLTAVLLVVAGLLIFFLLVRNNAVSKNTAPASSSTHTTAANSADAAAAATASAYMKLVTIIGQPTVKMVSGTTFEANGQVKNDDTFQHDITLKITLLDASGHVVGTATHLVDNVKAGTTVSYSIQGTALQPTWTSVEVAVVKISENLSGAGSD